MTARTISVHSFRENDLVLDCVMICGFGSEMQKILVHVHHITEFFTEGDAFRIRSI